MIDWKFVWNQLQQEPKCNDISLYRIGVHAGILTQVDPERFREGQLTDKMRKQVMGWLRINAKEIGLASLNKKTEIRGTQQLKVRD